MYQVLWDAKAEDDLAVLSEKDRRIVISKVDLLMNDARSPGAIKLSVANAYRLRAGRWRIFYRLGAAEPPCRDLARDEARRIDLQTRPKSPGLTALKSAANARRQRLLLSCKSRIDGDIRSFGEYFEGTAAADVSDVRRRAWRLPGRRGRGRVTRTGRRSRTRQGGRAPVKARVSPVQEIVDHMRADVPHGADDRVREAGDRQAQSVGRHGDIMRLRRGGRSTMYCFD